MTIARIGLKTLALSSVSVFAATGFAHVAAAQARSTAPAPSAALASEGDTDSQANADGTDVVVTGSRVVRDGFNAPTPVTVLGAAELSARADVNVADAVNQLPQLSNSVTQTSQPTAVSGGALGVNQLSLRALGPTRTLVLQDGKRVINSSVTTALAAPDINHIPNGLVSRVEVVTGGASAAYGSDALSGVVNFVFDHDFVGLKGDALRGITTFGDNSAYKASLTGGLKFGADGRGHILVSGEAAFNDGVNGVYRPWNPAGGGIVVNPNYTATNGQAYYLVTDRIGVNNATPGGVITSGPLRGTLFGQGGAVGTYDFGQVTANNAQVGGDFQVSRLDNGYDLVAQDRRHVLFGRASYNIFDNLNVYGEYQWSRSRDSGTVNPFRRSANVTIRTDNAFLPQSVRNRALALGVTSFTLGTVNADIGRGLVENRRDLKRWAAGFDGSVGVGGTDVQLNGYYQQSRNKVFSKLNRTAVDVARYNGAVDAVLNPATNTIVCRSTLTAPTNGCVPYNVFGVGVNTPAALAYVEADSTRRDIMKQDVAAANLSADPFSTWAGPVSIALGVEHRREEVSGVVTGNVYLPTIGKYHVTEGYAETVVPLARDLSWAKSLEFNGAVRLTDYSTSGRVTTWKLGATYAPINDIRFRVTRSRDIRAPNIGELFALGQIASGANIVDPFNNNAVYTSVNILRRGNPLLKPEVANTLGIGAVLTPSFIPNFQASVDFYKIDISGAVKIPNEQIIVNLCFADRTSPVCAFIERAGGAQTGVITTISTPPANVLSQDAKGIDFEVGYRVPLADLNSRWSGAFFVRGYGNYVISLRNADTTGVSQGAGVVGNFGGIISSGPSAPRFRSDLRIGYESPQLDVSAAWRFVSANTINRGLIQCASSCPTNSMLTISDNTVSSNSLFDASIAFKPVAGKDTAIFFAVDNILNSPPPFVPGQVDIAYFSGQYTIGYDRIGRTLRAGVRFRL